MGIYCSVRKPVRLLLMAALKVAAADAGAEVIKEVGKQTAHHISSSWKDAEVPTKALAEAFKQLQTGELGEILTAAKTCEYLLEYYAMNSCDRDQIEEIKRRIEKTNPNLLSGANVEINLKRLNVHFTQARSPCIVDSGKEHKLNAQVRGLCRHASGRKGSECYVHLAADIAS